MQVELQRVAGHFGGAAVFLVTAQQLFGSLSGLNLHGVWVAAGQRREGRALQIQLRDGLQPLLLQTPQTQRHRLFLLESFVQPDQIVSLNSLSLLPGQLAELIQAGAQFVQQRQIGLMRGFHLFALP